MFTKKEQAGIDKFHKEGGGFFHPEEVKKSTISVSKKDKWAAAREAKKRGGFKGARKTGAAMVEGNPFIVGTGRHISFNAAVKRGVDPREAHYGIIKKSMDKSGYPYSKKDFDKHN